MDGNDKGTRLRIVNEARALFDRQTYGATSMREIAESVGITKATLYHHFKSKAEILLRIIEGPISALETAAGGTDLSKEQILSSCIHAMLDHRETLGLLLKDASVYLDDSAKVMIRMNSAIDRVVDQLCHDTEPCSRIRAAQALVAAIDPIALFPSLDRQVLQTELLRGAMAVLDSR